jgi:hypothetical protein
VSEALVLAVQGEQRVLRTEAAVHVRADNAAECQPDRARMLPSELPNPACAGVHMSYRDITTEKKLFLVSRTHELVGSDSRKRWIEL